MHIAGVVGKRQKIDPGRPGVPTFGRRIYHLGPINKSASEKKITPTEVAIFRKTRKTFQELTERGCLGFWEAAYRSARGNFEGRVSDGIVFDYDGTLCDPRRRFEPLEKDVTKELGRLGGATVRIAVVTGRGRSVRNALQAALPSSLLNNVLVGYYSRPSTYPSSWRRQPCL